MDPDQTLFIFFALPIIKTIQNENLPVMSPMDRLKAIVLKRVQM